MITELILASESYCDILGVQNQHQSTRSTRPFILAMKYHPTKVRAAVLKQNSKIAEVYETPSDVSRQKEYDTLGHSAFRNGKGQRDSGSRFEQSFNFNFKDLFKDFSVFGQNQNTPPKKHFANHFQTWQDGSSRQQPHSQEFILGKFLLFLFLLNPPG